MAYTYTFQLAQRARVKLQREASRHDHNLRLLVGHANLLDSLMVSLVEAGREQENWFNETVRGNMAAQQEEEYEEEEQSVVDSRSWQPEAEGRVWTTQYDDESMSSSDDSDTDSEADSDEEMEDVDDIHYSMPALTRKHSSYKSLPTSYFDTTTIGVSEVEEYDEDFEDDSDDGEDEHGMYPLQRTSSHGSPPQLVADLSDEEDEPAPPSPPQLSLPFNEKASKLASSSPPPFSHERFLATDYLSSNTLISTY